VALADKVETLVGLFGIGQLPTGDKDPFALRRHALGVIRILIENNLPLELPTLLARSAAVFGGLIEDPLPALKAFFHDRLAVMLRDMGFSSQEVDAVLALAPARLGDVPRRLVAVRAFAALPQAQALAAANKRVSNILKKVEGECPTGVDVQRLVEPAEQALAQALAQVKPRADEAFARGNYQESMQALADLREPVDAFFDGVMVNADDPALRANRLGLLAQLQAAMNQVADVSRLAV
jgi:glycyl-tRNA synthetase beta chain